MLASGKCFSVLAKGVGLGGFKGGAEEQQQFSPKHEARSLLKAQAGTAGSGDPLLPDGLMHCVELGAATWLKPRISPVVSLYYKS